MNIVFDHFHFDGGTHLVLSQERRSSHNSSGSPIVYVTQRSSLDSFSTKERILMRRFGVAQE